jgi:hypothetical protein
MIIGSSLREHDELVHVAIETLPCREHEAYFVSGDSGLFRTHQKS